MTTTMNEVDGPAGVINGNSGGGLALRYCCMDYPFPSASAFNAEGAKPQYSRDVATAEPQ